MSACCKNYSIFHPFFIEFQVFFTDDRLISQKQNKNHHICRRQKRALSKTVNDKGEYPLNVVVKEDRAEKKIEQLLRLGEPVGKFV